MTTLPCPQQLADMVDFQDPYSFSLQNLDSLSTCNTVKGLDSACYIIHKLIYE